MPVRTYARPFSRTVPGFGLIELIVAISIVAILTAAAIPSFRELGRRMTVTEHTNDMVAALNMARAEAVKRGVIVAVVGTGSNWTAGGWSVRADSDRNGAITTADDLLATYPPVLHDYAVKTKVTAGNDAQIVFGALGSLATPATAVDVNVCRPDHLAAQSAWIHIVPSGEITSRRNTTTSPAPGC